MLITDEVLRSRGSLSSALCKISHEARRLLVALVYERFNYLPWEATARIALDDRHRPPPLTYGPHSEATRHARDLMCSDNRRTAQTAADALGDLLYLGGWRLHATWRRVMEPAVRDKRRCIAEVCAVVEKLIVEVPDWRPLLTILKGPVRFRLRFLKPENLDTLRVAADLWAEAKYEECYRMVAPLQRPKVKRGV